MNSLFCHLHFLFQKQFSIFNFVTDWTCWWSSQTSLTLENRCLTNNQYWSSHWCVERKRTNEHQVNGITIREKSVRHFFCSIDRDVFDEQPFSRCVRWHQSPLSGRILRITRILLLVKSTHLKCAYWPVRCALHRWWEWQERFFSPFYVITWELKEKMTKSSNKRKVKIVQFSDAHAHT